MSTIGFLQRHMKQGLKNANERIASQRDEIGSAIRNSIILKTCLKKIRSVLEENSGRYARDDFYKDLDRLTEFVLEILDGEGKADLTYPTY